MQECRAQNAGMDAPCPDHHEPSLGLRAVIAHCWQGGPEQGWYPWAARSLRAQRYAVQIPALPAPQAPRRQDWINSLDRAIAGSDAPLLLIGHSLGALAALHWLAGARDSRPVHALLLVAPPLHPLGIAEVDAFLDPAPDLARASARVRHKAVLVSDADPYLRPSPQAIAQRLAQHDFELITAPGMGHFAPASGLKTLPALAEWSRRFSCNFT